MNANFEYIASFMILVLIMTAAEINIFSIMNQQLAELEQKTEQLNAEKILDILLLSNGNPEDWGNKEGNPTFLGLADQNALRAYVLDVNKVYRLTENSSEYIQPSTARELLGLNQDFHFNLTITPIFTIDVFNDSTPEQRKYEITVTDYKGFRSPNIQVTGFYIPTTFSGVENYQFSRNTTGLNGKCSITFDPIPDYSLVVGVNQLEVKMTKSFPSDLNVKIIGDQIISSNLPVIENIKYSTAFVTNIKYESVSKFVDIDGLAYNLKFDLWR